MTVYIQKKSKKERHMNRKKKMHEHAKTVFLTSTDWIASSKYLDRFYKSIHHIYSIRHALSDVPGVQEFP